MTTSSEGGEDGASVFGHREWRINRDEVSLNVWKPVGEGGFGKLYLGLYLNSTVVVKTLDISGPRGSLYSGYASTRPSFAPGQTEAEKQEKLMQMFKREADVWFRLNHPHVVQLFGACDVGSPAMLVCEYATNGSLDKYLIAHPDQLWRKLHETVLGVQYLHERGIVHGDLKCNNVVVGSDVKAKVTDFGLSSGGASVQISGAVPWLAPECLGDDRVPPTIESDIYSLGMCVIEGMLVVENICSPPIPWGGISSELVRYHVKRLCELPPCPGICNDDQWSLVQRMCAFEPSERIKIDTILYTLERFAEEETRLEQPNQKHERLQNVDAFEGGELLELMDTICGRDKLRLHERDQLQHQVFRELEALFAFLIGSSPHRESILRRFHALLADFNSASADAFLPFRVLDLMSPKSTQTNARSLSARIDELWRILRIGELESPSENDTIEQIDLLVAPITGTWLLSRELKSAEERNLLVESLSAEIANPISTFTEKQRELMKSALEAVQGGEASELATTPRWYIPWHELVVDYWSRVSSGAFGRVYQAKWLGSDVAVKELTTGRSSPLSDISFVLSDDSDDASPGELGDEGQASSANVQHAEHRFFMLEVETWFQLSHPHVVRLYGACHVGTPRFVCEYAANGSLDKYLRTFPHQIWLKLHEAALGVQYLHERGILHGDLKCNNIVVASDGAAKVTDFGLSSHITMDTYQPVSGAWHWVAPELLDVGAERLSVASDVYSFAMCVIEALRVVEGTMMNKTEQEHPRLPWQHLTGEAVKVHLGMCHIPPRPSVCTDDQWDLVKKMCCFDPSARVSISFVAEELKKFAEAGSDISAIRGRESSGVKEPQQKTDSTCAACGSTKSSKYPFCGYCGSTQRPLVDVVADAHSSSFAPVSTAHTLLDSSPISSFTDPVLSQHLSSSTVPKLQERFTTSTVTAIPKKFDNDKFKRQVQKLQSKCTSLPGSVALCCRPLERLAALYDALQSIDQEWYDLVGSDFGDALQDFNVAISFQLHYKPVLYRLATFLRLMYQVYWTHMRTEGIYKRIGVMEDAVMANTWCREWEADRSAYEDWLTTRIGRLSDKVLLEQLGDPEKLPEVLALLVQQLEIHGRDKSSPPPTIPFGLSAGMVDLVISTKTRFAGEQDLIDSFPRFVVAADLILGKQERYPIVFRSSTATIRSWRDVFSGEQLDAVELRPDADIEMDATVLSQLTSWLRLDHENVLKLYGVNFRTKLNFLLCEPVEARNTYDTFIDETKRVELWTTFRQVVIGLQYLRENNVPVAWLTSYDIRIMDDGTVKLMVFASMVAIEAESVSISYHARSERVRWKAPEQLQLNQTQYDSEKAVVYSLGLCVIDAASGEIPFGVQDDQEILMSKLAGVPVERPDGVLTDTEWELIARMTSNDPQERPTLEDLIADMDQLDLERREGSASNWINEQCEQCDIRMPKAFHFCGNCGAKLHRVELKAAQALAA